jgi:mRNA interferase RelE/StbE
MLPLMRLIVAPDAVKALRKMPPKDARALMTKLEILAAAPFAPYPWAFRLTNSAAYRVRHGDWRAVYRIDREAQVVLVDRIGNRREIYK